MIRLGIAIASIALLLGATFYVGTRWDGEQEVKRDIKIIKEIKNATTDERSDADIRDRLRELAGR